MGCISLKYIQRIMLLKVIGCYYNIIYDSDYTWHLHINGNKKHIGQMENNNCLHFK